MCRAVHCPSCSSSRSSGESGSRVVKVKELITEKERRGERERGSKVDRGRGGGETEKQRVTLVPATC